MVSPASSDYNQPDAAAKSAAQLEYDVLKTVQDCRLVALLRQLNVFGKQETDKFQLAMRNLNSKAPIEWVVSEGGIPPSKITFLFEYWHKMQPFPLDEEEYEIKDPFEVLNFPCGATGCLKVKTPDKGTSFVTACPFLFTHCTRVDGRGTPIFISQLDKIQQLLGFERFAESYATAINPRKEQMLLRGLLREILSREQSVRERLIRLKEEHSDLTKKLAEAQTRVNLLESEISQTTGTSISNDVEIKELKIRNETLVETNAELNMQVQKLSENISTLENSYIVLNDKKRQLEDMFAEKHRELDEKERMIKSLKERVESAESDISTGEKLKDDYSLLKLECENLAENLRARETIIDSLNEHINSLQSVINSLEENIANHSKTINDRNETIAELQAATQNFENRLLDALKHEENANSLRAELDELKSDISDSRDITRQLRKRIKELEDAAQNNVTAEETKSYIERIEFLEKSIAMAKEHEAASQTFDIKSTAKMYISKAKSSQQILELLLSLFELGKITCTLDDVPKEKLHKLEVAVDALKQGNIKEAMENMKEF